MFDPYRDLVEIQKVLVNDSEILRLMDLTNADLATKARRIIRTSDYDDLANQERRLCIFFRPSRRPPNNMQTEEVIQIDCHVPKSESHISYQIQQAVLQAIRNKKINGRYLLFDGQLGELPTANGYFCVGQRFKYYAVI